MQVTRELLQAFDHSKTGNLKEIKRLIAQGLTYDATIPFSRILDVSCINANMLQVASAYGRLNTVDFLLNNGVDVNYREGNGHYALHFAALGRHNQVIEVLLRHHADPLCKNFQGFTPIHFGCRLGGSEFIKILVAAGAQANAASYSEEITALHVACEHRQHQSAVELVDQIMKMKGSIDTPTKHGWTPLHYACNTNSTQIVKLLLKEHAKVQVYTNKNDTPLHFACKHKCTYIIDLIHMGADVNVQNKDGETPLIIAATHQNLGAVQILLEHDALVDLTTTTRQTALHRAVQEEHIPIVDLLLKAYINVRVVDVYGNTAVAKARQKQNEIIVKMIENEAIAAETRKRVENPIQQVLSKSLSVSHGLEKMNMKIKNPLSFSMHQIEE